MHTLGFPVASYISDWVTEETASQKHQWEGTKNKTKPKPKKSLFSLLRKGLTQQERKLLDNYHSTLVKHHRKNCSSPARTAKAKWEA